ncbi:type I restriction system specificity protein [Roseobacter sp. MED193]|uniref:restriction endonuclease subunit S n=1 Tax=Roseobacter sp. MED193 TaxID=314262 RepID=UPI000068EE2A|nr:restriction endonuclease subunit S [Roseobacter sp. MED193]EAQ45994.1 type I restriction system specificity protein [Roseobacter sp. MED193]
MSNRGFLEKLLDGAVVEWKQLGELTNVKTGQSVNKNKIASNPGPYAVINSGREPLGFIDEWNTDDDPIGVTTRGAGVGSITWQEGKYFRGNLNYAVSIKSDAKLETRYLYHLLLEKQADIHALCTFDGIPALNAGKLKGLVIPIPCPDDPEKSLAIQAEIVRILDSFTELTAELTAELKARKQQYNHYRDQLLSFDDGDVEWKTLGDVVDFQNAKPHEKLVTPDGDVALLTAGYISTDGRSARFVKTTDVLTPAFKNDVAMVMSDLPNGRALAKTFFVDEDGRYAANQRVCLLRVKDPESFSSKFLHYVMNRNKQLLRYDSGYDQTHLKKDWILGVKVPVPSAEEQNRIVTILDKFNTLTASLSEGLPREIKLRQQQYEYYRDLLLSFPKPEEAA